MLFRSPDNVPVRKDAELQVTPKGQVLQLDGARSIFDWFAADEKQMAADRPPLTRDRLQQLTGIRRAADIEWANWLLGDTEQFFRNGIYRYRSETIVDYRGRLPASGLGYPGRCRGGLPAR